MKANIVAAILVASGAWVSANAVPVLQVGVPASGTTCGPYAAYSASSANPTEADTAITGGNTLCVGGVYQNNKVQNLGAQFGAGSDWSALNSALSAWNGKGAVLVASVADGKLADAAGLQINGQGFFGTSLVNNFFPNNHAPVQDGVSDFLFFDIGNFAELSGAVADFASSTGAADGEVKALTVSGQGSLAWIHFDVMALETTAQGGGSNVRIVTTIDNNPGSHDVTWKPGRVPPQEVPEPGTALLMGVALLGLAASHKRRQR